MESTGDFLLTMLDFAATLHWADICQLQFTPVFLTGAEVVTPATGLLEFLRVPPGCGMDFFGGRCVWGGSFRLIANTICLKRERGIHLS